MIIILAILAIACMTINHHLRTATGDMKIWLETGNDVVKVALAALGVCIFVDSTGN